MGKNKVKKVAPAANGRINPSLGLDQKALGHHKINLDHIATEEDRQKTLHQIRGLPCDIGTRRRLLYHVRNLEIEDSKGKVKVKPEDGRNNRRFENFKDGIVAFFMPWNKSIKSVEGLHGAGVASYFLFLRWLFGLNFVLFVLMLCFVVIPMALLDEIPLAASADTSYNLSFYCSANYSVVTGSGVSYALEFIQGTGWMEKTLVFYGYYVVDLDSTYNLPLAYVLTVIVCLVVSLGMMTRYTASSFRSAILSAADNRFMYNNKVFCAWDYGINEEEAVELKQKGVHFDVQSELLEQSALRKRMERLEKTCSKIKLYLVRIVVNLLIIVSLGAGAYLIYFTINFSTEYASDNADASGAESWLLLLIQYLPSLTITGLNIVLPLIFEKIVLLEDYSQSFIIKITLIRTVFLRLASMIVLVISLYSEITCSPKNSCRVPQKPSCTELTCWESYVGQQFYKLVITDFVAAVVKVFLVELPRRLAHDKLGCKIFQLIGPPEFNIPANVLDLVYGQCLVWLGFLFTPMLPGMAVAKSFILFYVKLLSALKACSPSDKPYRGSRIKTFFMVILLVTYFLCALPVSYVIFKQTPSTGCGSFRVLATMDAAIQNAADSWPDILTGIYNFFTSPAFIGLVIVALCMAVFYLKTVSSARKAQADLFKDQLIMETRDKQALLTRLRQVYANDMTKKRKPGPDPAVVDTINEQQPRNNVNDDW